jgi:serpin B
MRLLRLVPALVLTGTLSVSTVPSPLLTAPGVARSAPDPAAPVGALASSITGLGYRMRTLTPTGNWVASPLSVAYAFAMLRAGAGPETAADLDRAFGFPPAGLDAAVNTITQRITTGPVPVHRAAGEPVVSIGNGFFVQRGLPVGKPFLTTLARYYGAGVRPVDFTSGDAARAINGWVSQQTNGKIPHAYDPQAGDVAALVDTVYLHADWASPFLDAQSEPFAGAGSVPTMLLPDATLPYAQGPGWTAVDLPYAHSDLVMRVMIPAAGGSPDDLLRPATMSAIAAALRPADIELHVPKWTTRTSAGLEPLGPPSIYGGGDLSGISPGLVVSRATHDAYIGVDETGTEAAAATTIVMAISGRVSSPTVVRADRPFAFAIIHKPTSIPLFVGRVVNPAAPSS